MMQRKASKKTRSVNAQERRFMHWTKEQPCCVCGNPPPSIGHHCWGVTEKKKVNGVTVLIGPWAALPLCLRCDAVVTRRSRRAFENLYGRQVDLLLDHLHEYPEQKPEDVMQAFYEMAGAVVA